MDQSRTYIFCFLVFTINLLAGDPIEKCTIKTQTCPLNKDLWYQRAKEFPCFGEGLNYTCMKAVGGILVEACINGYGIRAHTGRCPYIFACDGIYPVLHNQANWPRCPEAEIGCPPGNHPAYTVYHMYKYPACIVTNVTELQSTTLQDYKTLDSQLYNLISEGNYSTTASTIINTPGHNIRILPDYKTSNSQLNTLSSDGNDSTTPSINIDFPGHNIPIIVIVFVSIIMIIAVVGFVVGIYVWRRKRRCMDNRRNPEEESFINLSNIDEKDISAKEFHEKLYQINYNETKRIPVSPLQKTSTMSMEELFAPVSIREDLEYRGKGRNIGTQEKRTKPVNCPDDMFLIDGDRARNVFMLGDAAIGKSVFCLRLVENWCKANNPKSTNKSSNPWVGDLKKFDFLFLVQLRHVDNSRTSVLDMICNDVFQHHPGCHDVIHRVISGERYRCLIVIDGLDEWKISDKTKRKLKVEGLPNTEGMANCTFVWSMRPWVMDKFSDIIRGNDRVIEIQGLNSHSINMVIEKLLVKFYELDKKSVKYTEKVKKIKEKLQDSNFKSLMQIPLMAIACVQIWYEEKDAGKSMTSLYVALIEMVMRRSNQKSPISSEIMDILSEESSKITNVPTILVQKKNIKLSLSVLMKLGKVASEDLISNQTHLVFSLQDLESYLQSYELECALKSGLLSKCEAPGSCDDENISINFFHKSIQEFLAAVYIENCGEMSELYKHLSSIKVIMELGNVLIFLSGLNPMLGSSISQHIVDVANGDTEICKYRTFSDTTIYSNNKAELLYKLQTSCYREITYLQTSTDNTHQVVPYHVSDVVVWPNSDIETRRITADILTHHHADITSLLLVEVPTDVENGVPDSLLTQYLDHTVSLQSLWISGYNTDRTLYKISDRFSSLTALLLVSITLTPDAISTLHTALQSNTVIQSLGLVNIECQVNKDQGPEPASLSDLIQILPDLPRLSTLYIDVNNKDDKPVFRDVLSRLSHLHGVLYYCTSPRDAEYDCGVVQTLCTWSGLRRLYLGGVRLGDSGLQLSHDMLHMETVLLHNVDMSPSGWTSFIQSVLNIKHKLDVELYNVDIDKGCMTMVRQSPDLNVTLEKVNDDGRHEFYFTRVWPSSKQGHK